MPGAADREASLVWSAEALADLTEIWNYHAASASLETAGTVIRSIERASAILRDHPLAGRARDESRPGLRSVVARPYVIFYRVRGNSVEVVRVLHSRRDLARIFRNSRDNR